MTYHGKVSCGVVVFDGERPPEGAVVEVLTTDVTNSSDLRDPPSNQPRSVEYPKNFDALNTSARLDEFRFLKNGWLEGKGKSPPSEGLDWLTCAFMERYPGGLIPPHLYPTAEGGVQAEWTLAPFEISLEIDLTTRAAQWHSLHLQTGQEEAASLDLKDEESWKWIADQIKRKAASAA